MMKKLLKSFACLSMAALPLCGLLVFFELTGSAALKPEATMVADVAPVARSATWTAERGKRVARRYADLLPGVSAIAAGEGPTKARAEKLDAAKKFATFYAGGYHVGFRTIFPGADGKIMIFKIVRRDLVTDGEVSVGKRAQILDLASSAQSGSFVEGNWRYGFIIEEFATNLPLAVQPDLSRT